jgi:FkbM family methyltransferase
MNKNEMRKWIEKSEDFFSQYGEDKAISDYIGDAIGNILEIGANDGETLSNSLHFIKKGWGATLIEASPITFERLQYLHKDNDKVQCLNLCLSDKHEEVTFYHNTDHMGKGDKDLLSTIDKSHFDNSSKNFPFESFKMKTHTISDCDFLYDNYKIISIDIEGMDYKILKQLDLNKLSCDFLIIETHNENNLKKQVISHCSQFGVSKILLDNGTNTILTRDWS